jgi:hypothetical protein
LLPASGISPLALHCSAARLLACRCEARTSKRTFTRPQRQACCQTAMEGSEFLPYLFSSATQSPSARSVLISIPGLSREPPGDFYNQNPLLSDPAPLLPASLNRRSPSGFPPFRIKAPDPAGRPETYCQVRPIFLRSPLVAVLGINTSGSSFRLRYVPFSSLLVARRSSRIASGYCYFD